MHNTFANWEKCPCQRWTGNSGNERTQTLRTCRAIPPGKFIWSQGNHRGLAYLALMLFLSLSLTPITILAQEGSSEEPKVKVPIALEELEALALENNPTIAQAEALLEEAEGKRLQAGLDPNLTFGYSLEEMSLRQPKRKCPLNSPTSINRGANCGG